MLFTPMVTFKDSRLPKVDSEQTEAGRAADCSNKVICKSRYEDKNALDFRGRAGFAI